MLKYDIQSNFRQFTKALAFVLSEMQHIEVL